MAHEILRQGAADFWLKRIDSQNPPGRCVFFLSDIASGVPGHCVSYSDRPSICRLFGFATVRNRMGEKMLSVCRVLKQKNPQAGAHAIELQHEAPCFPEVGTFVYAQDPILGSRLLPINQALREALMCLGLHMEISQSEALGNTSAA